MRPGSNTHKTIPVSFHDPELGTRTEANPCLRETGCGTSSMAETLLAIQEKKRMLRRGETTIVRLGLESIRVFLCMDAEDVRDCVEESDIPQTWLQARQAS